VQLAGAHLDELALEVLDHPGGGQPLGVPGEADPQARLHQAKQPAGDQVTPG
jgi:hypothetical protein